MYSSIAVMFLALAVLAVATPISVPLTHNVAEATSFSKLDDDIVSVDLLSKYTRDNTNELPLASNSVMVTCTVTIGSKPFKVLLDTGSALLAVPTSSCSSCDSGAPNSPYSPSNNAVSCANNAKCTACCTSNVCDTSHCAFTVGYADGSSINGSLYTDTVTLGGLSTSVVFGGITQESKGFVAPYADGIMGFSLDGKVSCAPSCYPPVFPTLVANGQVANTFGIYLDTSGTGELTLGGLDPSLVSNSFAYTPLKSTQNFYQVDLSSISVGSRSVVGSMQAILDTGTTYITLPVSAFNDIVYEFQSHHCDLTGTCSQNNIFNGNCLTRQSSTVAYPNLVFQFNGVAVTVTPRAYFLPTVLSNGDTVYCFAMSSWDDDYAIMGYSFMRGYYIHYDVQNTRVGFAGANATSEGSSSDANTLTIHSSLLLLCISSAFFL